MTKSMTRLGWFLFCKAFLFLLVLFCALEVSGESSKKLRTVDQQLFENITNSDKLKELLNAGADVNCQDKDGYTPALIAARNKLLKSLNVLVKFGANLRLPNNYGEIPLSAAIKVGDESVANFLVEHGSDVSGRMAFDNDDSFPTAAARNRMLETLKSLINAKVALNSPTKLGVTPLIASIIGHWPRKSPPEEFLPAADLLVKHGVDVDAQTQEGLTALDFARKLGQRRVIELLMNVGARENPGLVPITEAASKGNKLVLKRYLSQKVSVDARNLLGETSLIRASENGHVEIVKILIEAGADVNARAYFNLEPSISFASRKGHEEVVNLLLKAGADVNAQGKLGFTPLMSAAIDDRANVARLLLDNGADPHALNFQHSNALTLAVESGSTETAKVINEAISKHRP